MSREMKNSGIEWIGRIPKTWEVKAGKYCLTLLKRIPSSDDQVVTCFRDGEVTLRSERREEGFTISEKEIGYQGVKKGDLVVHGMDGFAGAIGISKFDGKGSPILNVLDSYSNKQFLAYYLRAAAFKGYFLATATGIRVRSCDLRWPKLAKMPILLPPFAAQQAIADYLDFKCSQIDQLSDNIKQQIEELGEYKKALITQAITKGLDPDVEMKDSGIKWVGEIPSDWSISKLKYVASIIGGNGFPEYLQGEDTDEIPFYKAGDISAAVRKISDSRTYISRIIADKHRFNLIPSGAILMPKIGEAMKKNSRALSTKICCIDNNCQAIVPSNQVEQDYCYYLLCIVDMNDFDNAGTIPSLNNSKLLNLQIPFPPKKTQHAIANYLDSKCSQIDALIQTKSEILNVLQEYKKSLIFDYVTGKKEVPVSYRKDGCHE